MASLGHQLDLAALREASRRSLFFFAKGVLQYNWLSPEIHLPVAQELENISVPEKVVVLPRGWLKSTLCSIAFPIWLSIQSEDHPFHGPNVRVLVVQNTFLNACKKLAVIRGHWEKNPVLRAMFPELLPGRNSTWKGESACITRTGNFAESTYEAAGAATAVVSRHYDVIVEDDTVAPDLNELGEDSLAPTTQDVANAIGWHKGAISLLNRPGHDLRLVVGTRWYDEDLIRYVIDNEPHYKVMTRACRENENGEPDAQGKITYPVHGNGDPAFDAQTLQKLETAHGPYMFSCLYMNLPVRREDMAFKPEWFQDYVHAPPTQSLAVYTTIDPATDPKLSKTGNTDYSVVMTCGKDLKTGFIYVLDYFRKKCNPGELVSAIFAHVERWSPVVVGYEDIAYQKSIDYWIKNLMRQENKHFNLQPLKLSRQKDAKSLRIAGLQPLFNAGTIFTRSDMNELKSELLKFPLGSHDDLADALSMQMAMWKATRINREYRRQFDDNPLSMAGAIKELRSRGPRRSLVTDPAHCSPLGFVGRRTA